ncbi:hypothetical protein ACIP02_22705 [Pseudomonas sp. NPDC089408]|uniref:hypothetical protein n=1 Tax=Pseudomonas sp. NPDC089408 TaxID=3364465 RepID=UPI0037F7048A
MNTTRAGHTRYLSTAILSFTFGFILFSLNTPYANAGTITLVSKPIGDFGERRCNLDIPAAGSGKTLKLSLADKGGPGVGNCYDMQPTEIIMQDIPSAAEILLTDDWLCGTALDSTFYTQDDPEDNKSFVIRLETTRQPSQLPEIGIDRLVEFEQGKYLDYPNDKGESPVGFKLAEKTSNGAGRVSRKLSCLEIKISDDANTPVLKPVALGDSTLSVVNEKDSDFECKDGRVITRRWHTGDENGSTSYFCTAIKGYEHETFLTKKTFTSAKFPECGRRKPGKVGDEQPDKDCNEAVTYHKDQVDPVYFTCPPNTVMTGRKHEGDENGLTNYTCSALYLQEEAKDNQLIVEPGEWEGWAYEYQSTFSCGDGKVMIGRAHKSDENGPTEYRCGQLFYPPTSKHQVTP